MSEFLTAVGDDVKPSLRRRALTSVRMPEDDADALAAARYRWLVEQIRDELGAAHGWKTEAARRLGVSDAYVGYIEAGERTARSKAISSAQKKLGLDFRYFHDPDLGERPAYQDHIVTGPEAHWRAFKRRYKRIGQLTPKQLDEIKLFAARNLVIKSPDDYERLADMVLRDEPSPTFEAKR